MGIFRGHVSLIILLDNRMFALRTLLLLAVGAISIANSQETLYAHCELIADACPTVSGTVDFRQRPGDDIEIKVNITGLDPTDGYDLHGIHIHSYGDLSDLCSSFEGHWNPYDNDHGAPWNPPNARHPGDWGNLEESSDGDILTTFTDYYADLSGELSIVGHGLVLHEHFDDLGLGNSEDSLTNGNSGSRYGCCVVGLSDDRHW